jgi:hypothetical protein
MFIRHPIFSIFGLFMIGWSGWTQMRGLGGASVNEGKVPPKSIRDNPGSYRSHYGSYQHYTGGK